MFGFLFICTVVVIGTILESVQAHRKKNELQSIVWKQAEVIAAQESTINFLHRDKNALEADLKHSFDRIRYQDKQILGIYAECEKAKEQLKDFYENE